MNASPTLREGGDTPSSYRSRRSATGLRERVRSFLIEHHDEDLTYEGISLALALTLGQVKSAIWGLRSDDPYVSPRTELGHTARPGHVRYYANLEDRPLGTERKDAAAISRRKVMKKRSYAKSKKTQPPRDVEPAAPITLVVDGLTAASRWLEKMSRRHDVPTLLAAATASPEPTTYVHVGALRDGRVVLASPTQPGVLLVAEPYGSLLNGPNQ